MTNAQCPVRNPNPTMTLLPARATSPTPPRKGFRSSIGYRAGRLLAVWGGLALGFPAAAQAPPDAAIFLVELKGKGQAVRVSKPIPVTPREGYNNQPAFTPDGKALLYTSIRGDGQADTYRYDVRKGTTTQLTRTPESEYSPTVTPDGRHFSVVRVEKDKTQRLWQFPLAGAGEPTLVLERVQPVGYHCWLDADWLGLFILGKPNFLQLARVGTGDTLRIEGNIGRSLRKVPGKNALSYVHKRTPTAWDIRQLDLQTRQTTTIAPTLPGSEDFAWTPDGALLMCGGTVLYRYRPGTDAGWVPLADLGQYGIGPLTRLALDPTGRKLALVGL